MVGYNQLQMSSELQGFVYRYYGMRLQRADCRSQPHHLYTPFLHPASQDILLLRTVNLPSHLSVSDCIATNSAKRYHSLLAPMQIVSSDRKFEQTTYLVKAATNVILLSTYLRIKQECHQPIQPRFFLRFIEFLLRAHSVIEVEGLPHFRLSQIGISRSGEFTLCDPALYFRNSQQLPPEPEFPHWIQQLFRDFFKLPPNFLEYDPILEDAFSQNYRKLCPLLEYLLSGRARKEETPARMAPIVSRISEGASTVSASCADLTDLMDRSLLGESRPFRSKGFSKVGKVGKIVLLLVLIVAAFGGGFWVYRFLHRSVTCDEGYFLDGANQCMLCADGCTRCQNQQPNTCSKCEVDMYLVLNREEEKQGLCLKECRGRIINMKVCIRDNPTQQTTERQPFVADSYLSKERLSPQFK